MAEPNVLNISSGPAALYLAATGTAFPSLASQPAQAAWLAAGFFSIGYTEAGIDLTETPSVKEIIPDELITVAKQIVTGVKYEIKTVLLEATLENMSRVLALATISNPGTGIKTLSVGSGNPLVEFALGVQCSGVGGAGSRVLTVWRVNSLAATSQNFTRKDVTKLGVMFTALSDSTKAVGLDVYQMVDFSAGS